MEPLQLSIYLVPILVAVVSSTVLGVIAWRHREYQYAKSLVVLLFGVSWWSVAYVVGLGTTVPAVKRFAYSLTYPAIGLVSIAWFVFAVQYTGRMRVPTRGEFVGLGIVPVVTTVAALTNQHHGLIWSSVDIVTRRGIRLMMTSHGPIFWVQTLQSYALVGVGTACLVVMAVLSDGTYRTESAALVFAAVFPLIANLLYLFGITATVDLTPAAFALSGTLLVSTTFRDQFLQSMPLAREIARDELIRQMNSPVIVVDKRARVVDSNPAAESLKDAPGNSIGSHIESVFPAVAGAVDLGSESVTQSSFVRSDGEATLHYEVKTLPLRRGGGSIKGQLLRIEDVTELRERERELVEERQFIDQALDSMNDLFYVLDRGGDLRRWNRQLLDITGCNESELEGMDALEFFPDEERERVTAAMKTWLQGDEATVEADLLTADGERVPHEFTGARLKDNDGATTGVVGIGRDISVRKERERRLRTFRKAVENAGRMIYWLDRDGTVEYVNPALETQMKCDASELVGERTLPLADNARSETMGSDMLETLSHGETWEAEFTVRRNDGEQRQIDQTVKPVYDAGGLDRFVAVAGDITERKRQNQQLSVLQRILRHDLRNSLNEILLSVQLAKQEATNDTVLQQLDGAERTVNETLSLSQDVREFKRAFEAGGIENKVVDIGETTREQVATVRAERTDVDFTVDISGSHRVVTNDLIGRAIRNVLRNAVQHNDSDRPAVTVTLGRRPRKGEIELCVEDNGPGIPSETIEVLRSERENPLDHLDGFGLWLVNWIMTLSSGSLELARTAPRGTEVKLVLPAARMSDDNLTNQ